MSTPYDYVALSRRWFEEVWNEGKLETVHQLAAPNLTAYGQGTQPIRGPDAFLEFVHMIRGAFPDVKLNVEEAFGSGDRVVVRWSATMTHKGNHLGIAATNKPVHLTGITVIHWQDGKVVEGWDSWDQLGMWQSIGAVPRDIAGSFHARGAVTRAS